MTAAAIAPPAAVPAPAAQPRLVESIAVGILAAIVLLGFSRFDSSVYNNYVLLADAFWHRHVWIDWPGPRIDALPYKGRYFIIEGPVPALLMVPFVAFTGAHLNQTAFTCVAGGVALGAAFHLARMLGASREVAAFMTTFFALGTSFTWCAIYGAVWFAAHIFSVGFAMLALCELVGKRRPWLIALLLVLAAGSRFSLSLAIVPLLIYALSYAPREQLPRQILYVGAILATTVAAFVWYNQLRWGVPNDIGYTEWYHSDQIGEPTGSPFRLSYVPWELRSFFWNMPHVVSQAPWVVIGYSSVPLTLTTPALILAAFAREPRRLLVTMWVTALLIFIPNVMYYANGGSQFGMRHSLDFEPFLFVPIVRTVIERRIWPWVADVLCAFSVLVGIWGIWFWRTFYDSMLVHHIPGF